MNFFQFMSDSPQLTFFLFLIAAFMFLIAAGLIVDITRAITGNYPPEDSDD